MISLSSEKHDLLRALDIPIWIKRKEIHTDSALTNSLSLQSLNECVKECRRCPLHATRTQTVFGVGNQNAKLMIIGEAPGFYEDQEGEPFVGRAGQLLNAMLQSIGLERTDVYIANILKCRPPNNRDPVATEVAHCTPYLKQQIDLIKPQVLYAVGRIAGQYLINSTESLSRLRHKIYHYGEKKIPLLISYHPAYLLRNPEAKAEAYQDLLRLRDSL